MFDVTWVIVSFGNLPEALRLIESLGRFDDSVHPIVVENSPTLDNVTVDLLREQLNCSVVHFADNPGYLGALHRVSAQIPLSHMVVLSNADLLGESSTAGAISTAYFSSDTMMLAPSIFTERGRNQNPYLSTRPSKWKLLRGFCFDKYPRPAKFVRLAASALMKNTSAAPHRHSTEMLVWAPHGSVLVFTPHYRQRGGSWDYPCRLFNEEIWCAHEVERNAGKIDLAPTVRLRHRGNATTGTGASRSAAVSQWHRESSWFWVHHSWVHEW